jgi:hypothetical protein
MGTITRFEVNKDLMNNAETVRNLTVKGSINAKFTLIALQDGTLKYYNFEDDIFELGHAPKSNLSITMSSSTWRGSLTFPSGGGTYVIKLLTESGTMVKGGSTVISHNLEKQASEATVTLTPATTNGTNYQTFPTTVLTGSVSNSTTNTSKWTINNASTDAGGFGLKIHEDLPHLGLALKSEIGEYLFDTFWYVETSPEVRLNANGNGEDSDFITVTDVSGLSVGMVLFYYKGHVAPVTKAGAAVTDCVITNIDNYANTIRFSKKVAFEESETMTLRAYGSKNIYYNNGMEISFSGLSVNMPLLQKTVRATVSASQTITLTDTHGISGGNTISYIGLGVNNASNNRVNIVTPDCPDLTSGGALDNDGQITVELAQTLSQGTVLSFYGVFNQMDFEFGVKILKFPESDASVNLDLDKMLTVGVSGA